MSKHDHEEAGEVSEVNRLDTGDADTPISPADATAGYPDSESGEAQEGEAGPNAAPSHDVTHPDS